MKSVICILGFIVMSTATLSIAQETAGETPLQKNAWSVLGEGLTNKNSDQRVKAVRRLGEITNNPKAEDAALTALKDDKPEVRAAAAQALGEMGAKSANPQLHEALHDDEPSVILASAYSLVQLGDDTGYGVYYAVLTGEQKTGTSLTDQQKKMLKDPKKMAALGVQAGIGFVPFGGLAVTGYKMLTRDDTSPVLAAAALMLAKDPDPKSGDALVDASANKEKWLVRAAAFDAIAKRGDPSLLHAAIDGFLDPQVDVQYSAAAAALHLVDVQEAQMAHPKPVPQKRKPAPKR
jgi:HEAT repeat protein